MLNTEDLNAVADNLDSIALTLRRSAESTTETPSPTSPFTSHAAAMPPTPQPTPAGEWELLGERHDVPVRWPDGTVPVFPTMRDYRHTATGERFTVGTTTGAGEPDVDSRGRAYTTVVHTESNYPVAVFYRGDDFDKTGDLIALIRGAGQSKRGGYDPATLPGIYDRFRTERFRDRIAGHWTKLGVVAPGGDVTTMLDFGALQWRERFGS